MKPTKEELEFEATRKRLHTILTAAFADEFQKQFNQRYSHSGGPDGSAMKRFLIGMQNDITEDQFRAHCQFAWTNQRDKFLNELTSMSGFLFHWNRISAGVARSAPPKSGVHTW